MPGLAALLSRRYDEALADELVFAASLMQHEPFYRTDTLRCRDCPVIGVRVHLDVTNRGTQPIYNEDGTLRILMDGELHSRDRVRSRLLQRGHQLRTTDDAELVLHAFEESQEFFEESLNGYFLAVIHDGRHDRSVIINDHLGLYPCYYSLVDGGLMVSSELKCTRQFARSSTTLSESAIVESLVTGGVADDRTFYEGVYRLPPASVWTLKQGNLVRRQYFNLRGGTGAEGLSQGEYYQHAARILAEVMPRYYSCDGIGVSLTGGWDTRTVVASMKANKRSARCYTWNGPYGDSQDTKVARKVAGAIGEPLEVLRLGEDFFRNFEGLARKAVYLSDGAGPILIAHDLYLNRLVRQLAPIRLSGRLGTQFASGIWPAEARPFDEGLLSADARQHMCRFDRTRRFDQDFGGMLQAVRWFWPHGYQAIESSQVVGRTPFTDRDFVSFAINNYPKGARGPVLQKMLIQQMCPALARLRSDKGDFIPANSAAGDLLRKLRRRVVKSTILAEKLLNHEDLPHWLCAPGAIARSLKLDWFVNGYFCLTNYPQWLRQEFARFVQDVLLDSSTLSRSYVDRGFVMQMVSTHLSGRRNYTKEIGRLMSLELWRSTCSV